MPHTEFHRAVIVTAALICLSGVEAARAQDATAWNGEDHAAARLLAGALIKTGNAAFLRAGIEIRLDPGWKTYWRQPGDSGVPPALSFAGSDNVEGVTVLWPAPQRFPDGAGGYSIGYEDRVILPLRIVPRDAAARASLHLKLGYAVCGNLCVPADATLDLALPGTGVEEPALEQAEARVPRRIEFGAVSDHGLAIRSVHRQPGGERERVVVEVAAPEGAAVDLFVEGPTPDWALPLPEPSGGAAGVRRFTFELDGLPSGARGEGALLTFTAVGGDDAIEVQAHLD